MPSGASMSLLSGARGSRPERCGQRRRGCRRFRCGLCSAKLRASRGGRYAERAALADVSRAHRARTSGPHHVHPGHVAGLHAVKRPPMDAVFGCDVLRCAVVRRRCGPQRPTASVSRPLLRPPPSQPGRLMSRAESNSGDSSRWRTSPAETTATGCGSRPAFTGRTLHVPAVSLDFPSLASTGRRLTRRPMSNGDRPRNPRGDHRLVPGERPFITGPARTAVP